MTREQAAALDREDPLARYRAEFVITDPELIYLDGNSLGRLPRRTVPAVDGTMNGDWGDGLVRSWHEWIDLPERVGDRLAPLIGARPGEVLVCDQTSVNLYKLAWAALAAGDRRVVVADDSNFPSDRYVLEAVARSQGGEYREVQVDPVAGPTPEDLDAALDEEVGLVSLSMVSFRSGAIADAEAITRRVHEAGALGLWDLSHAAGAIPVRLEEIGADLAVGCTYKHLNGGPGAPAFLYVRRDLQEGLRCPIPGWFGHDDMFAFESSYRPAPGIRRFAVGTPPVLSLRAAQAGIEMAAEVGIEALRDKSRSLTRLIVELHHSTLAELGFALRSPAEDERRGGHVGLAHPAGFAITQALIARGVVPDFRAPDLIRLGVAPLYNTHVQVFDAMQALAEVVTSRSYEDFPATPTGAVT